MYLSTFMVKNMPLYVLNSCHSLEFTFIAVIILILRLQEFCNVQAAAGNFSCISQASMQLFTLQSAARNYFDKNFFSDSNIM